mmetsp:Transcript_27662/g.92516  ORF Transcript_27662/g.92516 Transcript_27662/m.92516 type:complete len:323 (+) Transcript_27662:638-1606(+)
MVRTRHDLHDAAATGKLATCMTQPGPRAEHCGRGLRRCQRTQPHGDGAMRPAIRKSTPAGPRPVGTRPVVEGRRRRTPSWLTPARHGRRPPSMTDSLVLLLLRELLLALVLLDEFAHVRTENVLVEHAILVEIFRHGHLHVVHAVCCRRLAVELWRREHAQAPAWQRSHSQDVLVREPREVGCHVQPGSTLFLGSQLEEGFQLHVGQDELQDARHGEVPHAARQQHPPVGGERLRVDVGDEGCKDAGEAYDELHVGQAHVFLVLELRLQHLGDVVVQEALHGRCVSEDRRLHMSCNFFLLLALHIALIVTVGLAFARSHRWA